MAELKIVGQEQKEVENKEDPKYIVIMERYDFSSMVICSILSGAGYNPKVVRDPKMLVEEIKKGIPRFLFYDLDYENEEDKEMLSETIRNFPDLNVIIIRWVGQEVEKKELMQLYGANGIVQRPFSRREVLGILKAE